MPEGRTRWKKVTLTLPQPCHPRGDMRRRLQCPACYLMVVHAVEHLPDDLSTFATPLLPEEKPETPERRFGTVRSE